jgi:hypothetical protein
MTFAEAARRLCGQCALLLGWRPAEFWDTTPAELACILGVLVSQTNGPPDAADMKNLMELHPDG